MYSFRRDTIARRSEGLAINRTLYILQRLKKHKHRGGGSNHPNHPNHTIQNGSVTFMIEKNHPGRIDIYDLSTMYMY